MIKQLLAFTFSCLLGAASLSAQIAVENNRIVIGEIQEASTPVDPGTGIIPLSVSDIPGVTTPDKLDNLADLVILGKQSGNIGGRLTFGTGSNVYIGDMTGNQFLMRGYGGLRYVGRNIIFNHTGNRNDHFVFYTDVDGLSFNATSDARLKKDVTSIEGFAASLAALNPVSYRLTGLPVAGDEGEETAEAAPDDRLRYGFIAQEVKEVFPELVSENADGYLSIDYIGFIPMLVEAVKSLNAKVEEQRETIESLQMERAPRQTRGAGIEGTIVTKPSLSQNRPNPFSSSTRIDCTLPETVSQAVMCVYDLQGKQVMKIGVEGRGATSVTIDGQALQPGMYIYALIADREEIDSKRMILTD